MKKVEKIDRYKVGNFILSLRTEKGLSQTQLGMILGVTNKAVSKWENGDNQPEAAMLYTLASTFGVEVDEILNGERKKPIDKNEIEKENMFLKLRLQEAEAKERRESRIFFLTNFYLLTVVVIYFAFVWVTFSRLAHYNSSLIINFLIGFLSYIAIPIILASFVNGVQCLLILVRRNNPVLIIIMLALLPITLVVLEAVGFALLIPMLIKNKKRAFSEEEIKKIKSEKKFIYRVSLTSFVVLLIGFASSFLVAYLLDSNSFVGTLSSIALLIIIAVFTIYFSIDAQRKRII